MKRDIERKALPNSLDKKCPVRFRAGKISFYYRVVGDLDGFSSRFFSGRPARQHLSRIQKAGDPVCQFDLAARNRQGVLPAKLNKFLFQIVEIPKGHSIQFPIQFRSFIHLRLLRQPEIHFIMCAVMIV